MGYEIELKAHVKDEQLDSVKSAISSLPDVRQLGPINKFDMYWSRTEDGDPLFRTRREATAEGSHVLFTAKPNKTRTSDGTEENQELEFIAPDSQWDSILTFCSGLGLEVCRLKWKKGFHYHIKIRLRLCVVMHLTMQRIILLVNMIIYLLIYGITQKMDYQCI